MKKNVYMEYGKNWVHIAYVKKKKKPLTPPRNNINILRCTQNNKQQKYQHSRSITFPRDRKITRWETNNDKTKQRFYNNRRLNTDELLQRNRFGTFSRETTRGAWDMGLNYLTRGKPYHVTLPTLQTNADTFANSVDQDETAHIEPSHLDLHYLPFCSWYTAVTILTARNVSKCWDGIVYFKLRIGRVDSNAVPIYKYICVFGSRWAYLSHLSNTIIKHVYSQTLRENSRELTGDLNTESSETTGSTMIGLKDTSS